MNKHTIPENYIGESRIFNGLIKTRNFVEACIVFGAVFLLFFSVILQESSLSTRIIVSCWPAIILGFIAFVGIDGEPLSTAVKSIASWISERGVYYYQIDDRGLKETPLEAMLKNVTYRDKVVDKYNDYVEKRRASSAELLNLYDEEGLEFDGTYLGSLRIDPTDENTVFLEEEDLWITEI